MVRVIAFILKVKGSNLMSGVVCGQQWYVDRIFYYLMVGYMAYLPLVGF
jgi:hypothetical protein